MRTQELIAEAFSLPVEERMQVVDSLLKSLNPPHLNYEKQWAEIARKRLQELRIGLVKSISGEEVFRKIWDRFEK
ncbi:addiction module protein [Thiothrix sp.]|jgi:hypothetical protein|uniref:addiction module protein n=1 Tax=Thiothrix sp. TaxID=1032 RepID=UPI00257B054E|nr:addiction module protein [Thiothrix sp.]